MPKSIATWSGGKDSCLALHLSQLNGHKVTSLVNTISDDFQRVRFHGIPAAVIQQQADVIGIPLFQKATSAEQYQRDFLSLFTPEVLDQADSIIFGGIFLEDNRQWATEIADSLGLTPYFPLWGMDESEILNTLVSSGIIAILTSLQRDMLPGEWIGRTIDTAFIRDISALGVSPCGENGEDADIYECH